MNTLTTGGEEEALRHALHADIFGDDDSDEDDDISGPKPLTSDECVQGVLVNRGGGGAEMKRKRTINGIATCSDEGRPEKSQWRAEDADSVPGGTGISGGNAGSDIGDGDSGLDGEGGHEEGGVGPKPALEAIEEGGPGDFDRIISGIKGRRGGIQHSRDVLIAEVQELQARMEVAADRDEEACKQDDPTPAVHKLAMLREVTGLMQKRHAHDALVDVGMLSTISRWLKPLPDGSLVTLQVRTALLHSLNLLEIDETTLGALRSSGIGKYVKLLSLHAKELLKNRRQADALIEKWSRPIFGSSAQFIAADMPSAQPRHLPGSLHVSLPRCSAAEEAGGLTRGMTSRGTRIPRPLGMDFSVQPTSLAAALPSSKLGKETIKGKLQDRIIGATRKKSGGSQAFSLSIEGRTLDRV